MSNGQLELLICDCDGVLVDTEHLVSQQLNCAIQELFPGVDVSAVLAKGFGKQIEDILQIIERDLDLPLPEKFSDVLNLQINRSLLSSNIAIPGVKRALENIDLPVAVVSNSHFDRLHMSLKAAGLAELIGDNVFSADLVSKPKPYPDVYQFAAERMGVDTASCLVIEDSISGVTAAKAAGMKVWGYVGASHIPPGHAESLVELGVSGVFSNMDELPSIISRYLG